MSLLLSAPPPDGGADERIFSYRSSRGFLTYTGLYKGTRVSIVSIGMGYSNMDFFVREVRAIAEGPLVVVRVGSCGAIAGGQIGMLAVPDRGALMVQRNYDCALASKDSDGNDAGCANAPYHISRAYPPDPDLTAALVRGSVAEVGEQGTLGGINASSDSFYSSQGRTDPHFADANRHLLQDLLDRGVTTMEMETAHLFHLSASVRSPSHHGIRSGAIHVVVADRSSNQFLTSAAQRARLDAVAARIALDALVSAATGTPTARE